MVYSDAQRFSEYVLAKWITKGYRAVRMQKVESFWIISPLSSYTDGAGNNLEIMRISDDRVIKAAFTKDNEIFLVKDE